LPSYSPAAILAIEKQTGQQPVLAAEHLEIDAVKSPLQPRGTVCRSQ
jgi:hypothetical protein